MRTLQGYKHVFNESIFKTCAFNIRTVTNGFKVTHRYTYLFAISRNHYKHNMLLKLDLDYNPSDCYERYEHQHDTEIKMKGVCQPLLGW